MTKSGAGTLVLGGGANNFSGGVTVNGGVLNIIDAAAVPSSRRADTA